jgi:hypothetical protein
MSPARWGHAGAGHQMVELLEHGGEALVTAAIDGAMLS